MMDELLDGELGEAAQDELKGHLSGCPTCRNEFRALQTTTQLASEAIRVESSEEGLDAISAAIRNRIDAEESPRFIFSRLAALAGLALLIFGLGLGSGLAVGAKHCPKVITERVEVPVIQKEIVRVEVPVVEEKVVIRYVRVRQPGPRPAVDHERKPALPEHPQPTEPEAIASDSAGEGQAPFEDSGVRGSGGEEQFVMVKEYPGGRVPAFRPPWDSAETEDEMAHRLFVLHGIAPPDPTAGADDGKANDTVPGLGSETIVLGPEYRPSDSRLPWSPEWLARAHGRIWEESDGV